MSNKTSKNWYQQAIIYGLDIETFYDGNGDGVGDFAGATAKLDYLADLGVNCLWLLPFNPSGGGDNGYDVTDYCDVDPLFGTLADFEHFVQAAKRHNMCILLDLVVHHTSDQHPWFQAAQHHDPRYYDYYVWSKELPPEPHDENIFPTAEDGVWQFCEAAGEYYHHKFYHFQPDLNMANPAVQARVFDIMEFWLKFGVDGFRIDAAPHILEKKGLPGTAVKEPGEFLEKLCAFVHARNPEAILLAEADVEPKKLPFFFGEGNRLQLLYNFLLNNSLFLSLADGRATPVRERLAKLQIEGCFANFVRNLDELDLEMITDAQRERVYAAFAPDENMRAFGRGIRRRVAPMLQGNQAWLKFAYSFSFAAPGATLLVYGDEIGMGDDLTQAGRMAVRSPMQWDATHNAGFSAAPAKKLVRPVITTNAFSYKQVNVAAQQDDPDSLLAFFKRLIALRKQCPEIGAAHYRLLETNNPAVLALAYTGNNAGGNAEANRDSQPLLTLHNFEDRPHAITLPDYAHDTLRELLSDDAYPPLQPGKRGSVFTLNPYGYRWFCTG